MANILITGGSRGIGAEAVRQFTAAGHKVVFTYHRSETAADLLRQETGAVPVRCDVKHPDSVKIAVDKAVSVLGQIDVLICNAAIADYGLITDLDISRWEEVIKCEAAYSAAKAGVIGLTKALAKEVGPSGIRVNCISPGMIDTDMNASVSEDAVDMIVDETPLCRTGAPSDVARAMLFLASDDASFITGQVISVNGGLVI